MTDERSDNDSGDDEQSEESSGAEVINGDADDTKNTRAHDTQMRYSPSFLPENPPVCVETDVNRPKKKGQSVLEGTQIRSVQQTATQATRQASEPELKRAVPQAFKTSCTVVPDSVGVNHVTFTGAESHSRLSTRAKSSSLCQREVERARTPYQLKVQNRREKIDEIRFPATSCVKSNSQFFGQRKLTVTVCPQCKAVYRSGGMECHDTMSRLEMDWSMRMIPKNKVSTGTAETMEKLWDHRDSVREGTVKQRNVKARKATHFRSETESLQVNKNRSRCGHMNTVTGEDSLGDPVSGEE